MALLEDDELLDLEGPPSSSQSDQWSDKPLFSDKRDKKNRLEDKRSSIRALPWTKSKDSTLEKTPKKSKHNRNKSGSRTPPAPVPDSPKLLRGEVVRGNQPSPNIKNNRKTYSQLGDWSDEESVPGYTFSNEPALASSPSKTTSLSTEPLASPWTTSLSSTEPLASPWTTSLPTEPLASPGRQTTVQFPVLFSGETQAHTSRASVPLLPMFPLQSPTQSLGPLEVRVPASPPLEADWKVSDELRDKCTSQFQELSTSDGLLQGDKAREFFVLSKLPNQELSTIWRLADVNRDNALSEGEFCVAMKLVMMRRNGHEIPSSLPTTLLPYLVSRKTGPLTSTLEGTGVLVDFGGEIPDINTLLDYVEETSEDTLDFGVIVAPGDTLVDLGGIIAPGDTLVDLGEAPDIDTMMFLEEDTSDASTALVELEDPDINMPIGGVAPGNTLVGEVAISDDDGDSTILMRRRTGSEGSISRQPTATVRRSKTLRETGEILINIDQGTPQPTHKTSKKYQALDCSDDDSTDGDWLEGKVKGHSRGKSLDLNKMISGRDVLKDLPLAEPPKLPPRPHASPPLEHTIKTEEESGRVRSLSTGSIHTHNEAHDTNTLVEDKPKTLVEDKPKRKHRVAPRRPPPPVKKPEIKTDKKELQVSIRQLKDQNAGLTEVNKALETQLFKLMEERVRLEHQLELLNI
ncbi:ralBP1-associated Eps domain-containing protein 1-like isoform X2 [Halichondria panicea]|uniref:ralBP1-associated Eps domain-containing protein 1-like isoform X2 n=1 Tax=Halichondria panicea TaxID=6063 RepID=UPI00312BBB88